MQFFLCLFFFFFAERKLFRTGLHPSRPESVMKQVFDKSLLNWHGFPGSVARGVSLDQGHLHVRMIAGLGAKLLETWVGKPPPLTAPDPQASD